MENLLPGKSENIPVPPVVEQPQEAFKELELKELQRSEQPIDIDGSVGNRKKVETIRPWNNYTLVMLDSADSLKIFDENAELIEDFNLPLSSKKVLINWSDKTISLKIGKNYIAEDGRGGMNDLELRNIPIELKGFAKSTFEEIRSKGSNANWFTVGQEAPQIILNTSNITTLSDKYIILSNRNGAFFTYVTKNDKNVLLAPRNWKRLGPEDPLPEDLKAEVGRILGENEGYKKINESYYSLITDVGINIFKNGDTQGTPIFTDRTPSVERNLSIDPVNPNVIYYCQSSNPHAVNRLDLSGEPDTWKPISAEFPQRYDSVRNLQLDPTGNFFLFHSKEDLVIVAKDTLDEVKRVPNLTQVNFDGQGRIRAVDKDGHLVIYEPNFSEVAQDLDKRRVAKLADGIKIEDIFDLQAAKKDNGGAETLEYLEPLRYRYQSQFEGVLAKITTEDGVLQVRQGFNKLREALRQQGLKPNEVSFILEGLEPPILEKEKEFAAKGAKQALASVKSILAGSLSITTVSEARSAMDTIKATEALLDMDLRQEFHNVGQELEQKSLELFRQRGSEVIKDIQGILTRTKTDLEKFTSKMQMDDWLEFRYPQLKSRLGSLAHDVPLEADEAYKAIVAARAELQDMASTFEEKFKQQYAKVCEKAVERTEATVDTLETDMIGLIDRLRSKNFADRTAAEQYLESSEAKKTLEEEIAALAGSNPDISKELEKVLKVRISNTLTEIERGGMTKVAETGQQMILFGETPFPKWEAKVKEKVERQADLVFDEDEKTHGPGVKADKILGDVAINITTSAGKIKDVRLYEGWKNENEWRFGLLSYRGESIPPSYVTAADYKKIRNDYSDWSKGDGSELQKQIQEIRDTLKEIYNRRPEVQGRADSAEKAWSTEYKEKLKEYAQFVTEHHIPLLRRIDQIKAEPEIEYTNGKGFIPEWQSHWVNDPQTEKDLEEMAKAFKMQIDLQEGMLNLKGHAGTGKDVRIKMFCALTNRPYFGIDCTKWTTEFELSEDVMLESENGASQTVKVPSAVLNGVTTPGALVYFNEFNAMPEQAQIFLHALMDEKRSLTLKTSSGKTIHALPSVLLASSMNPGYPGTFDPQFATRSRMVSVEVGYPPLIQKPESGDRNQNDQYDASEALRIARGVDSLSDLTYEASLERNEFVKMWNHYVNGVENGAPNPNGTQKFDIDTTLALVQFANKLRVDFIKIFEKSRDARNALPVSQPITGRELRRSAYGLSRMTPEEKATANPEVVARQLLDKYFLTHIDKKEDQEKIRTAMNTWTSQKRLKA